MVVTASESPNCALRTIRRLLTRDAGSRRRASPTDDNQPPRRARADCCTAPADGESMRLDADAASWAPPLQQAPQPLGRGVQGACSGGLGGALPVLGKSRHGPGAVASGVKQSRSGRHSTSSPQTCLRGRTRISPATSRVPQSAEASTCWRVVLARSLLTIRLEQKCTPVSSCLLEGRNAAATRPSADATG